MTAEVGWQQLLERNQERVHAVLNQLLEAPYFYRQDDEASFNFLRRHRGEFNSFFELFFGWILVVDNKCARVYKEKWYNGAITESNRDFFNFTKRDDCIAFMIILEFFEHQLDENDMSVEETENLRFRFGDLLEFCTRRFTELFTGEQSAGRYTHEYIRGRILRQVIPVLERYRFLRKVPPPADERISEEQTIYEALAALYHYNSSYLHRHIDEVKATVADTDAKDGAVEDGTSIQVQTPPSTEVDSPRDEIRGTADEELHL
ncbi:MAG: DUF2398 family protein [Chitinivibrionales bacterium]|nr:DUF2398 family protein [Chitinivibrionales bacterium]